MRVTHGPSSEREYTPEEERVFDANGALQAIREVLEDKEGVVGKQLAAVLEAKLEKGHLYHQYAFELLVISIEETALKLLSKLLLENPTTYPDISLVVEAAVASLQKESFFSEEEIENAFQIASKKIGNEIERVHKLTSPLDNAMRFHRIQKHPNITPEIEREYDANTRRLDVLRQVNGALYELRGSKEGKIAQNFMEEIVRDAMVSEGRAVILRQAEERLRETLDPENWPEYPEVLTPAYQVRRYLRRTIH